MQDSSDGDPNEGTRFPSAGSDKNLTFQDDRSLVVVGIGASAGGLEALEALLQRVSSDGMAFVIYQHLAADHESLLPEILARRCTLKVVTAIDRQPLEPSTVYVAPPGVALRVEQGRLRLDPLSESARRHPIDVFMASLARACGPSAIGVVLSGAGTDGTLGLQNIKEAGGITFAQEPATARHPNMPQSAVDAQCADFVLPPSEIGDELMRMGAHPLVAVRRLPRLFSEDALQRVFRVLHNTFGLDFSGYKVSTLERRIARRMALKHCEQPDDYALLVEADGDEREALYRDLLIGVTSFFRDKPIFEALSTLVFPRMVEGREIDSPIRVWVPGCATGEEAYSLAIALLEYLDDHRLGFNVQVFASDINEQALAKARLGTYPAAIELDVSPSRLQRYFVKVGQGYQVCRRVRDLVVFAVHNLGKDPPFSKLDLVSCRNVLIYLQAPLQKKVIRSFHYGLVRDGTLMLGTSESVGEAADLFSLIDREHKLYVKKNVVSNGVFDFSVTHRPLVLGPRFAGGTATERRPIVSAQQLADRKVIDRYAPPGVIIDEHLQVVQFRGHTAPYFSPAPGMATLSIFKLVRPELMVPVRNAIQTAQSQGLPVSSEPVTVSSKRVGVDVIPLRETDQAGAMLVLFREHAEPERAAREQTSEAEAESGPGSPRVEELERDLLNNKEYLEAIIHELETANEELQGANEELQSANEELQSTNEELETSKEELQSSNEELATVNEELQTRMAQLAVVKDDLSNLLQTMSVPIVLVGADLRIRRFSVAAEKELNLIEGDIGRPASYLATLFNVPQFEQLVSQTMSNMHAKQQNIRCSNGSWYTLRTSPYRTAENTITGVVVELLGTPRLRRPSEAVDIHELVGKVLSTLPHALMLLDDRLRLIWANRAFFEGCLVGGEAIGRPLEEAWPSREAHPELWLALEAAAFAGKPFEGLIVPDAFSPSRTMRFSAQSIAAEAERPAMTLVVMEELEPLRDTHP